jgi:hypothetical protein
MNLPKILGIGLILIPCSLWGAPGDLPIRTSGFYAGIGGGSGQAGLKNGTIDYSGSDVSYKVLAGYRFRKAFLPFDMNVAVEGAYVDLGESDEQFAGSKLELAINGFDLSVLGLLPISSRWDVIGKAGLYFSDAEFSIDGSLQDDESGMDLVLGLGLSYQTGGAFGARVEFDAYDMLDGVWGGFLAATYQFK